ncbi:MAG TPA: hypothetical protein RMH99_16905 [Sandaracinaceae bacterium LLY-WYZ-13_1]|nr:hypothetical protein [Sandaracinaceae bacterium LLY-WYZ-13_1]
MTTLALALVAGCDERGTAGEAPPGRVVAVQAEDEAPAEELCDVVPEDATLALPALADGQAAPSGGRRWLNVWATWCRPCVEELPLLRRWEDQLAADGVDVDLVFLSADADAGAVATFRERHPRAPESLRMADPQDLPGWVGTVGLDEGATLPIHVLTDDDGRVLCARAGALSEDDYEAVRAIWR